MIWLVGNKGMLGTEISLVFEKNNISFIGTDIETDITVPEAIEKYVKSKTIKLIINCAAYTAVDKAEDDAERCSLLNLEGTKNLAVAANKINAKLIHISTDYVFNGKGNKPYTEEDETDPIGVYGLTKRNGELAVPEYNPNSYIIRTAWLYGKYGGNFVHTMIRLMNEKKEIKVVNDQRGSPTWTFDLAFLILKIINNNIPFGIYHYTNEGETTWFDFAQEIYKICRNLKIITKDCNVLPCSSDEFPAKVKRPSYSVLDKSKIKKELKIDIPSWNESLLEYLKTCEN